MNARTKKDWRRLRQIAAIHMGKKALELSDADYRAWLHELTGKASAKDLTPSQRATVLDAMRQAGFTHTDLPDYDARQRALAAAYSDPTDERRMQPHVVMIKGLWADCHRLGVVRDPSDAALFKFVARMARGIRRLEWVTVEQSNVIVEALKAMRDRGTLKHERISKSI